MPKASKLRVTQSLLSSWEWVFKTESGWDDFLATLHRERKQPTKAMLDGIRYENCLNSVLNGETIPEDHEWYKVITEMAEELDGAQQQVNLFADTDIYVDGFQILLHGVLDYLKAGHIYDCKFSKRYHLNKYLSSPQHPLYLHLVAEARDFTYIVTDGEWVYRERYQREIVPPIEQTITQFIAYLKQHELFDIFVEKWRTNNG